MDGVVNASITSVGLEIEDPGILTAWLHLDYGTSVQGFGGYRLYVPDGHDATGKFVWRCLEVVGVNSWAYLAGKPVRARIEGGIVRAIGHYLRDDWFVPGEELK